MSTIKSRTAKIHESLILQTEQNNLHHLDINQTNKNISLITEASERLKEQIEQIPDKYQITLDTDTKKEIKDTIDTQLYGTASKLDQVNETNNKIQDYITNAENHLNTILHDEKMILEDKNAQLSFIIKKLEESQISSADLKTNTINYLMLSEKRIISRINQLNINERSQYKATQIIQDSIGELQRNVKSIKVGTQLKNKQDEIHSLKSEIKEIINICQNLESRILAKLDNIPAHQMDIELIKQSQARFEETLLPKMKETLKTGENLLNRFEDFSRQDSIKQPPFSFRRKVLLALCIIISLSSISYIFLKYSNSNGLLDLLTNLWQTAWQKFNG